MKDASPEGVEIPVSKYGVIQYSREEEALPTYIRNGLVKMGIGMIMCICGSPYTKVGAGKSYTAMRLAQLIDPTFSVDKIAFTPSEFLRALERVEESGKPGQVIILDEGEVTAPSATWFAITNKAIAHTIATFRYLKCLIIVVTPTFSMIDKRIRNLVSFFGYPQLHLEHGPQGGYEKKAVSLRIYRLHTDLVGEKIRMKKLAFYDAKLKRIVIAKDFNVHLPTPELVAAYETKSQAFKRKLRGQLLEEIERFEKAQGLSDTPEASEAVLLAVDAIKHPLIKPAYEKGGRITTMMVRAAMPQISADTARLVAHLIKSNREQVSAEAEAKPENA